MIEIKLEKGGFMPTKAHPDDAGYDIRTRGDYIINPGCICPVDCGFRIAVPKKKEAQIRPKSGLALKGIFIANAPGTIDRGYTGIVKALVFNNSKEPITFLVGNKVAQMVICDLPEDDSLVEVDELKTTERGEGGFGSTGR